jgi:hypothetical protein
MLVMQTDFLFSRYVSQGQKKGARNGPVAGTDGKGPLVSPGREGTLGSGIESECRPEEQAPMTVPPPMTDRLQIVQVLD